MKKFFQRFLTLAVISFVVVSCGNPAKMAKNADMVTVLSEPEVLEVVAEKITTKVTVIFPEGFFHPKAVLEVVPVLVYEGGESVASTIMLQGAKVTENYITVPEEGAVVSRDITFDYVEGMEKSHLDLRMAVLYKDDRIEFPAPYKAADGANTTYMLANRNGVVVNAPDAYQAVIPEQGEAQILYLINSANVRPAQLKSNEIKAFQDFLTNVKADERREIKNTEIVAYASPDGKEDFNEKLSTKRADAANKAFVKNINKKVAIDAPIVKSAISEDWDGFKDLVQNSEIEDKDLILRVLNMYDDPMVREREIKNMSQVYTILAKEILPQLRRARFIANIEFTNYSDEELVELVNTNIDILDEEGLLHAATLVKDNNKKIEIYKKASSCRAKINLANTYLNMGKKDEAKAALNGVNEKDAYYYNTLGVIALRNGKIDEAKAAFAKSDLKETKINTAVIDILTGNYAEAQKKLNGTGDHNEPLADILVNDLTEAAKDLQAHTCARGNYLKAIVAARQGKVDEAKAALEIATKNEKFAKRAANDIEFAKIK